MKMLEWSYCLISEAHLLGAPTPNLHTQLDFVLLCEGDRIKQSVITLSGNQYANLGHNHRFVTESQV